MAAVNSINWKIQFKSSADRAKFLLETNVLSDCQFLVGNEHDKQVSLHWKNQQIPVMSLTNLFLAMESPVLEATFFIGMASSCQNLQEDIRVLDVKPSAFRDLLQ